MSVNPIEDAQMVDIAAAVINTYFENQGMPLTVAQKALTSAAFLNAVHASIHHVYERPSHPDQLILI